MSELWEVLVRHFPEFRSGFLVTVQLVAVSFAIAIAVSQLGIEALEQLTAPLRRVPVQLGRDGERRELPDLEGTRYRLTLHDKTYTVDALTTFLDILFISVVVMTILFFHQPVDATTTKLYCFDLEGRCATSLRRHACVSSGAGIANSTLRRSLFALTG